MNLFQNTNLIQAVREAYDLTIPQATVVLIAYQHGTVSTLTVREVLGFDARTLSATHAISGPVRKGLLKEAGRGRVALQSRPSSIYQLTDENALAEIIGAAAKLSVKLYQQINEYETTAKEIIHDQNQ